jgi:hypothetical protein
VVEHLPSKHEAMSSNSSPAKKKKRKEQTVDREEPQLRNGRFLRSNPSQTQAAPAP